MGKKNLSHLQSLVYLMQLGLTMIVPIVGGVLLGNFIDKKLSTSYLFLIICIVIGVLAAFRNLLVIGTKSTEKRGKNKDE